VARQVTELQRNAKKRSKPRASRRPTIELLRWPQARLPLPLTD